MIPSILLEEPLMKELEARCQQGGFVDVLTEQLPTETKLCDMSALLKGIQSLMIEKKIATNDAFSQFESLTPADKGYDETADLHNEYGSDAMILEGLRNYYKLKEAAKAAKAAGHTILDRKIHIRKGFIITMEGVGHPQSNGAQ